MISFENLSAGYGPCDVLQSVSAAAKPGELIALIGPNGCGKSTLLKTLCGVITPSSGRVTLNDKDLKCCAFGPRALSG